MAEKEWPIDHTDGGNDWADVIPRSPPRTNVRRITLLVTLGVVLFVMLGIGILFLMSGPSHRQLRKGLKDKNGIDVKTIDVSEKGPFQLGTVTTEQGDTYPIGVHTGVEHRNALSDPVRVTQWILGKQPPVAEEEIRKLVAKLGFEASSVRLQRNPNGVGYFGEVTARTGEVIDISEKFSGPPLSSAQLAELRPSSYDRWIRNTLEKELKEELASVSEFVRKDKSWAMEEGERQERLRAEEAERRARLKADFDKRMEAIRRSGREPSLGEMGAGLALIGPEPPSSVNVKDILDRMGPGQPSLPPAVVTYQVATAMTKGGRVIECEIEVQTSPARSINLSWREKKK